MLGVVATFDDQKGYGTLRQPDGVEVFFHCTRIADGTRTIDVGAPVTFDLVPGHHGRDEAADITRA
jgi:cold shock CspA family protein